MHAFDLAYETVVGLLNFGTQKMGLLEEARGVRDLDDARLSIELIRAILDVLERETDDERARGLHDALAQMQLAYAHAVQLANAERAAARERAPGEPASPEPAGEPAAPEHDEPGPEPDAGSAAAEAGAPGAKDRPAPKKRPAAKKQPAASEEARGEEARGEEEAGRRELISPRGRAGREGRRRRTALPASDAGERPETGLVERGRRARRR